MTTSYEFRDGVQEILTLETGEEFLLHQSALRFLEEHRDRPDIRDWRALEAGGRPVEGLTATELEWTRDVWLPNRIAELQADLKSGLSRLQRGYGGTPFNDEDSGILLFALQKMSTVEEDMPAGDFAVAQYGPMAPAARAVMEDMVEVGFQNAEVVELRTAA